MKIAHFEQFGRPHEVINAVPMPDPGSPSKGEVKLELLYAPIHPSDLHMVRGIYGIRPALPGTAGQEGVSRVIEVADDVSHLQKGDFVLTPYAGGTWRDRMIAPAAALFALPPEIDLHQAALLSANPVTAFLMLTRFGDLTAGEWVLQNAATSSVGKCVIGIARSLGLKTVNVVRREEAVDEVRALGGDIALTDGPDLRERIAAAIGKVHIRLGLEGVGGQSMSNLMGALGPNAVAVTYAAMSGQPFVGAPQRLIYANQTIRGFWLIHWLQNTAPGEIAAVQRKLVSLFEEGAFKTAVEAVYPLEEVRAAMAHMPTAKGKILLAGMAAVN